MISLFSIGLIIYAIRPLGVGLSEDSVNYMAAAESLLASGKLSNVDGTVFSHWPPLYPMVLTVLDVLPGKFEVAVSCFNICIYLLMLLSSWYLIKLMMLEPLLRLITFVSIVFSFTILQVYTTIWSEVPFILVVNLGFVSWLKYMEHRSRKDLFLLAFTCLVAVFFRYSGLFLIMSVGIALLFKKFKNYPNLLLQRKNVGVGKLSSTIFRTVLRTLKDTLLSKEAGFFSIAFLPFMIWLLRNYLLTDSLFGPRIEGNPNYWHNTLVMADTLSSWFLPIKIPLLIRILLLTPIFVFVLLKWKTIQSRQLLLFTFIYLIGMNFAYMLTSFQEPRDRLLAPVFIPAMIIAFSLLDRWIYYYARFRWIVIVSALVWLTFPVARSLKHVWFWHQAGVEIYNKPYWKHSPLIGYLKNQPLEGYILSNDPYALYHFTHQRAVLIPKHIYEFPLPELSPDQPDFLVWFTNEELYFLYDLSSIISKYHLNKVASFEDGTVYKVN